MEGIAMAVTLTTPNTLLGTFAPRTDSAKWASGLATVVFGSLFIAICSHINVPVWPVPVTLQTLAVALVAAAFGWRVGVATLVLYIVEGLCGLPVFAGSSGPLSIFSPSFGFILGFVPMAAIIGRAADAGLSKKLFPMLAITLAADVVCFAIGFVWLAGFFMIAKNAGLGTAATNGFIYGVQPFIIWDILKMAFVTLSVAGGWSLLNRKA
jgi:biotin transport system substrate-specific component